MSNWVEARTGVRKSRHRWAVVLAGGDGIRLQSLTLKIAGDSRPKQFCSIFGGESLLAQTRARLESLLAPQPHRLLAVRDTTSGWADLGSPTRVMEILARNSIQPTWLRDGNTPSGSSPR